MWFDEFHSPIGKLVVAADPIGIRHILFDQNRYDVHGRNEWQRDRAALREVREQLLAYFARERTSFDLPLAPSGTPFQLKVWNALAEIPFAQTCSYGDIARKIGEPKAVRAVGAANGRNPLPIVLPCHRVIGSDGSLTGFGGGLPIKQFLLDHEGARQARLPI
jgi:methylated-DNA-[protein]-cysteine S-methyltransferase